MKKKFNIVDICVILLAVVFIAGICIRFVSIEKAEIKNVELLYTIKVEGVRSFSVDAIKQSEDFSNGVDTVYGEVVDVSETPSKKEYTTSEGNIVKVDVPEKYDCLVSMKAPAVQKGSIYYLDDETPISVGEDFELITKYVKTYGKIVEVNEVSEG